MTKEQNTHKACLALPLVFAALSVIFLFTAFIYALCKSTAQDFDSKSEREVGRRDESMDKEVDGVKDNKDRISCPLRSMNDKKGQDVYANLRLLKEQCNHTEGVKAHTVQKKPGGGGDKGAKGRGAGTKATSKP